MEEYIVTANELVAFAQFLATTQPYLLHNIDFLFRDIPHNSNRVEWERVVPSLLQTILGNANYIDSVLISLETDDGGIDQPSLRVILNKLICLVVMAKMGITTEHVDAAYILNNTYQKLRILYMQVLGMSIPPGGRQTYVDYHTNNTNLRRTMALPVFCNQEDAKKRTVYCGDDRALYGVVFNVAVSPNYRQRIAVADLVSPPQGVLPVLRIQNPPDEFNGRLRRPLRSNHVYSYVAIKSVLIYPDGRIVDNPDGYPDIIGRAQQAIDAGQDNEEKDDAEEPEIVDLLQEDDEESVPPNVVIDDYQTAKPFP